MKINRKQIDSEVGELFTKPPHYSIDSHIALQTKLLYAIYDSLNPGTDETLLIEESKPKTTRKKKNK